MDSVAYKPLGAASNHMHNHNNFTRFESRHLKLIFTLIALFVLFIIYQQLTSQKKPIVVIFDTDSNKATLYDQEHQQQHGADPTRHQDDLDADVTINRPIWWTTNIRYKHIVLANYVRSTKSFNFNSTVTLTTQATLEFMYHTAELCNRWEGPLSVAVYAAGDELRSVITMIKYLRQCHPLHAECIKQKVTWHIVYDLNHGADLSNIDYPSSHVDETFLNGHQQHCHESSEISLPVEDIDNRTVQIGDLLRTNYRKRNQLPYPINVLRNTARLSAKTKYILASDIELYPSINMVSSFIALLRNKHANYEIKAHKRHIFTLPIFEVKENIRAPKTKPELLDLMSKEKAIFFHKYVCDQCQEFPRRLEWIELKDNDRDKELGIFEVTQRNHSRGSWEPIYIGTNDEPLYDDRLTWEGRRDKMGQMYEMCLQGYYLLILDNAFLVHAPGIKHINNEDNIRRLKYIKDNNKIYGTKMSDLRKQYQDRKAEIATC